MNDENIKELSRIIKESSKICVFTGAGISCPSGIPDFRSATGIYNTKTKGTYSPEEVISYSFFMRDTEFFYEFYKDKMIYPEAKPNAAHLFFAELEKDKQVTVVTQNIDGLHQMAGSTDVIELHGSIHRNYCMNCGKFYDVKYVYSSEKIPHCTCGGIVKPDVVLYEESLDENAITRALDAISAADTMFIIGTSLVVNPAASFVRYFRGNNLVLINKSKTAYDNSAVLTFYDDVVEVINRLKVVQFEE